MPRTNPLSSTCTNLAWCAIKSAFFLLLFSFSVLGPPSSSRTRASLFTFKPSIRSALAISLVTLYLHVESHRLHTRTSQGMRHNRSPATQSKQSVKALLTSPWHPHCFTEHPNPYQWHCDECHTYVTGVDELTRSFHAGRAWTVPGIVCVFVTTIPTTPGTRVQRGNENIGSVQELRNNHILYSRYAYCRQEPGGSVALSFPWSFELCRTASSRGWQVPNTPRYWLRLRKLSVQPVWQTQSPCPWLYTAPGLESIPSPGAPRAGIGPCRQIFSRNKSGTFFFPLLLLLFSTPYCELISLRHLETPRDSRH
ncbi:hypothetical protein V8C35DRAFT_143710 [Trichoderma chlorosporum]